VTVFRPRIVRHASLGPADRYPDHGVHHHERAAACARNGLEGLAAKRIEGFCNRATHNSWVLLEEAQWLTDHLGAGSYQEQYKARLNKSTYSRLIEWVVEDSGAVLSKDGRQQR
jgi:hypothetical protein